MVMDMAMAMLLVVGSLVLGSALVMLVLVLVLF